MKRFLSHRKVVDYTLVSIPEDGKCIWRAVLQSLGRATSNEAIFQLMKDVSIFLRSARNRSLPSNLGDCNLIQEMDLLLDKSDKRNWVQFSYPTAELRAQTADQYCMSLQLHTADGNPFIWPSLEIGVGYALATLFHVQVVVVTEEERKVQAVYEPLNGAEIPDPICSRYPSATAYVAATAAAAAASSSSHGSEFGATSYTRRGTVVGEEKEDTLHCIYLSYNISTRNHVNLLVPSRSIMEDHKPQFVFSSSIDNSRSTQFIPRLKCKYHSIVPWTSREQQQKQKQNHPYQEELVALDVTSAPLTPHWSVEACLAIKPELPSVHSLRDTPFQYVDTVEAFNELLSELLEQQKQKALNEIAVDLEHHSKRSFQGITCLMQISTRKKDYVIDTIALRDDLYALGQIFADPSIVKVLHGCKKDIEWLQRDLSLYVVNCFDTYWASHELNYAGNSLQYLIQKLVPGVTLNKEHQVSDWRQRPLTDNQLAYAREDTHYLLFVYDCMRTELAQISPTNKTSNASGASSGHSSAHNSRSNSPAEALKRVFEESRACCLRKYEKPQFKRNGYKSIKELAAYNPEFMRPAHHAVLAELWDWRDMLARTLDESADEYLMSDAELVKIGVGVAVAAEGLCHRVSESSCFRARAITEINNEQSINPSSNTGSHSNSNVLEKYKLHLTIDDAINANSGEDIDTLCTLIHTLERCTSPGAVARMFAGELCELVLRTILSCELLPPAGQPGQYGVVPVSGAGACVGASTGAAASKTTSTATVAPEASSIAAEVTQFSSLMGDDLRQRRGSGLDLKKILLSWHIDDVNNDKLLEQWMTTIPLQFPSPHAWYHTFFPFILEEMRSQLQQQLVVVDTDGVRFQGSFLTGLRVVEDDLHLMPLEIKVRKGASPELDRPTVRDNMGSKLVMFVKHCPHLVTADYMDRNNSSICFGIVESVDEEVNEGGSWKVICTIERGSRSENILRHTGEGWECILINLQTRSFERTCEALSNEECPGHVIYDVVSGKPPQERIALADFAAMGLGPAAAAAAAAAAVTTTDSDTDTEKEGQEGMAAVEISGSLSQRLCQPLNASQLKAVKSVCSRVKAGGSSSNRSPCLQLIKGPPGTGKTNTLVSLLLTLVAFMGKNVHASAPTNTAVCEVARRCLVSLKELGILDSKTRHSPPPQKQLRLADLLLIGSKERLNIVKIGRSSSNSSNSDSNNSDIGETIDEDSVERDVALVTNDDPLLSIFFDDRIDRIENAITCMTKNKTELFGMRRSYGYSFMYNNNSDGVASTTATTTTSVAGGGEGRGNARNNETFPSSSFSNSCSFSDRLKDVVGGIEKAFHILVNEAPAGVLKGFDDVEKREDLKVALRRVLSASPDVLNQWIVEDSGGGSFTTTTAAAGNSSTDTTEMLHTVSAVGAYIDCITSALSQINFISNFRGKGPKMIMQQAKLVFSTVNVSGRKLFRNANFDVVVIDEATQLIQPETAIALRSPSLCCLVLAGDDKQLPPTVISQKAAGCGYDLSLFDRLLQLNYPHHLLDIQYRMHPDISVWPRQQFYGGEVVDGDNVKSARYQMEWHQRFPPVVFFDIAASEEQHSESGSYINRAEAQVIQRLVTVLSKQKQPHTPKSMGIVSGYKAQRELLHSLVSSSSSGSSSSGSSSSGSSVGGDESKTEVRVSTIDGFQGQECDVIIFSTVRCNDKRSIGFMKDARRLNVAITRAKYSLIVIGNAYTLSSCPLWQSFIEHVDAKKNVFNALNNPIIEKATKRWQQTEQRVSSFLSSDISNLIERTYWEIHLKMSDDFKRAVVKITEPRDRAHLIRGIVLITDGNWPKFERTSNLVSSAFAKIIHVQFCDRYRLVWTVDVDHASWRQCMKLWNVVVAKDLPAAVHRVESALRSYSIEYLQMCGEKCLLGSPDATPESVVTAADKVMAAAHATAGTGSGGSGPVHVPKLFQSTRVKDGFTWQRSKSSSDDKDHNNNNNKSNIGDDLDLASASCNVDDAAVLMKFYDVTTRVLRILSDPNSEPIELPFAMSAEEEKLVTWPGSLFILGRSGTGKTTVILHRMILFRERHKIYTRTDVGLLQKELATQKTAAEAVAAADAPSSSFSSSGGSACRQLMITVSPILCDAIRRNFEGLRKAVDRLDGTLVDDTAAASAVVSSSNSSNSTTFSAANAAVFPQYDEYEKRTFDSCKDSEFPLILTYMQFLQMVDNSLQNPFFHIRANVPVAAAASAPSTATRPAKRLVDFERFMTHYYPHFPKVGAVGDAAMVYAEIMSHIKGSLAAIQNAPKRKAMATTSSSTSTSTSATFAKLAASSSSDQAYASSTTSSSTAAVSATSCAHLTRDEYKELSKSKQSNLTEKQRDWVYNCFTSYERLKANEYGANSSTTNVIDYDILDAVAHIYLSLAARPQQLPEEVRMHCVSVDEVQDLTPLQIALLKFACSDSDGFVFAGDTAQTIAHGVGFRFASLKDVFYNEFLNDEHIQNFRAYGGKKKRSKESMPDVYTLTTNFRTHNGVVNVANSVVGLITHFFPQMIDRMDDETSNVLGPLPIFLEGTKNLVCELFNKGAGSSATESSLTVEFGAEQAILVRDEETKRKVKEISGNQAIVLTVIEAKGMEFTDCLLYNFFESSSLESKAWRVIYNRLNEILDKKQQQLEQAQSSSSSSSSSYSSSSSSSSKPTQSQWFAAPMFDQHTHSKLCMELKLLYVLLTRARQHLVIFDESTKQSQPMLDFWKAQNLISVRALDDDTRSMFLSVSTAEEWQAKGKQFFERQQFENARLCFQKAKDEYNDQLCVAYEIQHQARVMEGKASSFGSSSSSSSSSAVEQTRAKYRAAAKVFSALSGQSLLVAQCLESAADFEGAAKEYRKLSDRLGDAARCFENAKLFADAATVYDMSNDLDNMSRCLMMSNNYDALLEGLERFCKRELISLEEYERRKHDSAYKAAESSCMAGQSHPMIRYMSYFRNHEERIKFLNENALYDKMLDLEIAAERWDRVGYIHYWLFNYESAIGAFERVQSLASTQSLDRVTFRASHYLNMMARKYLIQIKTHRDAVAHIGSGTTYSPDTLEDMERVYSLHHDLNASDVIHPDLFYSDVLHDSVDSCLELFCRYHTKKMFAPEQDPSDALQYLCRGNYLSLLRAIVDNLSKILLHSNQPSNPTARQMREYLIFVILRRNSEGYKDSGCAALSPIENDSLDLYLKALEFSVAFCVAALKYLKEPKAANTSLQTRLIAEELLDHLGFTFSTDSPVLSPEEIQALSELHNNNWRFLPSANTRFVRALRRLDVVDRRFKYLHMESPSTAAAAVPTATTANKSRLESSLSPDTLSVRVQFTSFVTVAAEILQFEKERAVKCINTIKLLRDSLKNLEQAEKEETRRKEKEEAEQVKIKAKQDEKKMALEAERKMKEDNAKKNVNKAKKDTEKVAAAIGTTTGAGTGKKQAAATISKAGTPDASTAAAARETSKEHLAAQSIKQLKLIASKHNVNMHGLSEKAELIEAIMKVITPGTTNDAKALAAAAAENPKSSLSAVLPSVPTAAKTKKNKNTKSGKAAPPPDDGSSSSSSDGMPGLVSHNDSSGSSSDSSSSSDRVLSNRPATKKTNINSNTKSKSINATSTPSSSVVAPAGSSEKKSGGLGSSFKKGFLNSGGGGAKPTGGVKAAAAATAAKSAPAAAAAVSKKPTPTKKANDSDDEDLPPLVDLNTSSSDDASSDAGQHEPTAGSKKQRKKKKKKKYNKKKSTSSSASVPARVVPPPVASFPPSSASNNSSGIFNSTTAAAHSSNSSSRNTLRPHPQVSQIDGSDDDDDDGPPPFVRSGGGGGGYGKNDSSDDDGPPALVDDSSDSD